MRRLLWALGITVTLAGCASSSSTSTTSGGVSTSAARTTIPRRANVISQEEIAAGQFASAGDIVIQLRPNWSKDPVYLDNKLFGNFSRLNDIEASKVKEIHLLSEAEAQIRWGTDVHETIWVVSK
jgi:Prokaryotic membrane lipoprotein lipid attachment site